MPCCLEYFCESGWQGRGLQYLVDRDFPKFACEAEKCSTFSPGPVQDDETLAFLLIDPLHYDAERNVVVPEAFQELTNRDLSVIRVERATRLEVNATRAELIARGLERVPPKFRQVDEVCMVKAADIRAVEEDGGGRLLAVYDTALEEVHSHASIFTRADVLNDRRLRKIVRNRVHSALTRTRLRYAEFILSVAE